MQRPEAIINSHSQTSFLNSEKDDYKSFAPKIIKTKDTQKKQEKKVKFANQEIEQSKIKINEPKKIENQQNKKVYDNQLTAQNVENGHNIYSVTKAKQVAQTLKSKKEIDFIFKGKNDPDSPPYFQDGNPKLYTQESLKKREELKSEQTIVEKLNELIELFPLEEGKWLGHEMFRKVFKTIGQILRKDLDSEQVDQLVQQEWNRESAGHKVITKQQLFDTLFELVDVWTPDIDKAQYIQFILIIKFKTMVALELD